MTQTYTLHSLNDLVQLSYYVLTLSSLSPLQLYSLLLHLLTDHEFHDVAFQHTPSNLVQIHFYLEIKNCSKL
jgi:hypothetical protein